MCVFKWSGGVSEKKGVDGVVRGRGGGGEGGECCFGLIQVTLNWIILIDFWSCYRQG